MKNIINFEKKFTCYLNSIENNLFDNSSYNELVLISDPLYSEMSKKDICEWLKSEIISKYDKNYRKNLKFNFSFLELYNKSCLKFDLIDDFLNKHNKRDIALSQELRKMFFYFKTTKDIYTPFKIISALIFYVKKDEILVNLIEECIPFFEEIKEYDQTILKTIITFVKTNFDSKELKEIKNKSNYF